MTRRERTGQGNRFERRKREKIEEKEAKKKKITQSSTAGKEREWGKPGEECRNGQQRAENNGQQSIIGLNVTQEDTK